MYAQGFYMLNYIVPVMKLHSTSHEKQNSYNMYMFLHCKL